MLLEVEHLSTEFATRRGPVRAIRDVSFSIDKGEILALVGESGSGKSVTSLSIMGLLASNGRVEAQRLTLTASICSSKASARCSKFVATASR